MGGVLLLGVPWNDNLNNRQPARQGEVEVDICGVVEMTGRCTGVMHAWVPCGGDGPHQLKPHLDYMKQLLVFTPSRDCTYIS